MRQANVIQFPVRSKPNPDSTLTWFDRDGWMEISPDIYEWFASSLDKQSPVHEYGFLHPQIRHAFVSIIQLSGGFVYGMSNRVYTEDEFDELRQDAYIDRVIAALGYEPQSV